MTRECEILLHGVLHGVLKDVTLKLTAHTMMVMITITSSAGKKSV